MFATSLSTQLDELKSLATGELSQAKSTKDLYAIKVKYLGKNGSVSDLMKQMRTLSEQERPLFGKLVNDVKEALEKTYSECEEELKGAELASRLQSESIDMTLPGRHRTRGSRHPVHLMMNELISIFSRLGFSVRLGPLIEEDRYNFEALNIPQDHPARDMQDTFYVSPTHVLRTQTSPIQIHSLEKEKLPLKILGPGAVFRNDYDMSHLPMFHQIEGMVVNHKVSMSDLKGTVAYMNRELFGASVKTRFRPSFFPFTEPSAEVDCSCPSCSGKGCRLCKDSGWLEMGGCGLVHPRVFSMAGIDSQLWQGFAFGFGVDRLAMVRFGIEDIRLLTENDTRFLRQF